VSRSSWIGDYLDPNTFLEVFVGGGGEQPHGLGERAVRLARARGGERAGSGYAPRDAGPGRGDPARGAADPPIFGYVSQNLVRTDLEGFHENLQDEHPPKFFRWKDGAGPAR
jgi:oligopeptide transport system substrate-binding protein